MQMKNKVRYTSHLFHWILSKGKRKPLLVRKEKEKRKENFVLLCIGIKIPQKIKNGTSI